LSIKGQRYTWFRSALERGDLPGVRSAAAELPRINLADALGIVLLMADDDDAYERAATRWVARLASERPNVVHDLAATVGALQALAGARRAPRRAGRVVRPLPGRRGDRAARDAPLARRAEWRSSSSRAR